MRANYKKLAEEYRRQVRVHEEHICNLFRNQHTIEEALREKEEELDEWMTKYVQVLNQLIDLQERVARKEGQV